MMSSNLPPGPQRHDEGVDQRTEGVIGGRYRVLEKIGQGGLAVVHRVVDLRDDRELALKRLRPGAGGLPSSAAVSLFEREFHTLSQLSHPRVVEVYDYQITDGGAFYTMELLDGGDLQAMAPLEAKRACSLMRDICSALCLLHSRRLVHRDISPRNIRCTADGLAKLIDFGAMIPMGASAQIVGTPAFSAPEVVDRQPLDARTDLYSLGTTLYFVLTGSHAYAARDFLQLRDVWQFPAHCPSELVDGIPRALADLVMELIQLEPHSRPSNAAVVMERLGSIAGLVLDEQLVVSQAYLNTPMLVGRDRKLARMRRRLVEAKGGAGCAVLVEGQPGMGRSRFVDASALEAKLLGFTVLRATPSDARQEEYAGARTLANQLLDMHPESASEMAQPHLATLAGLVPALVPAQRSHPPSAAPGGPERTRLQQAMQAWILAVSARHPLLLVADDFCELDEPSAALLALLAHEAATHRIVIIASEHRDQRDAGTGPLSLLRKVSAHTTLGALTQEHTERLLSSIFGEVSCLAYVAQRLHQVCGGNPRDIMQLAQHLVDRGVARYHAGGWHLPARIDQADLPDTLARALGDRIATLSAPARELAQVWAVAPNNSWTLSECLRLSAHGHGATLSALDELTGAGVLRGDGESYALGQPGWIVPLLTTLDAARKGMLHECLAEMFSARGDDFRCGQHLLWAGQEQRALDVLVEHARVSKQRTDGDYREWTRMLADLPRDCVETYYTALRLCESTGRPAADRYALCTRMSPVLNALGQVPGDLLIALVRQCQSDAGLDLFERLSHLEPAQRVEQAFAAAQARYEQLPEHARVLAPQAALRPLGAALVEAFGPISNTYDSELWRELPSLQPLAVVSPTFGLLERIRVAMGERLAGRYERAREGYTVALQMLEQDERTRLGNAHLTAMHNGLMLARALVDAAMGSRAVLDAANRLREGAMAVAALGLRVVHCLWQGDGEAADRVQMQFELERVQTNIRVSYDGGLLFTELCALSCSDDLVRLRRTMPALEQWAERASSWRPILHYAQGEQRRIGGDFERALSSVRQGLALVAPGVHQVWPMLAGAEVGCLLSLGQVQEAVVAGRRGLQLAHEHGLDYPMTYIELPLALALSEQGEIQSARRLAEGVIERMRRLRAEGVPLGLAFHHLARISLAAKDAGGFQRAAARCGAIFRHSTSQALASKYRRLMREARRAQRTTMQGYDLSVDANWESGAAHTYLTSVFETCSGLEERVGVAADLLAKHCGTEKVFVYLPGDDVSTLIATVGGHEPPPQLAELVNDYLALEHGTGDDQTITECAADGISDASVLWTSPQGERFHVVVLGHNEPTGFVITALAVVAVEADAAFVHPYRVASELSRLALRRRR